MFTFEKSELTLNITGQKYTVNVLDRSAFETVAAVQQSLIDTAGRLESIKLETEAEAEVKGAMETAKKGIDAMLGEGAFDEIFKGRIVNLVDIVQLVAYIAKEVNIYRNKRMTRYIPS